MHNWDDFRYFHAVATHGSFSAAAQELGVNHSTVSRRIQVLEEKHGVRLFERTSSGYNMTEAGAGIFDIIEEINERSYKASRVLLGQDARLEGRLNLTMPHDLFECCMAKPIKNFCQQHPNIDLRLLVRHGLRNLADREADLAVRMTPNPPDYLIGKCITLLQHGIYRSPSIDVSEATPIVCWGGEEEIPHWATEHLHNPYIALWVDDLVSMYAAVKAGIGLARMPCFYPDGVQVSCVERLRIDLPRSDWGVWVLSHVDLRQTARVNHCKAFLIKTLTECMPLFEGKLSRYEADYVV